MEYSFVLSSNLEYENLENISLDNLSGEKFLIEQDIISASKIKIYDQNLYVLTKKKDSFIQKIDLNGRFIESFFQMGSGPREVLDLSNFGFINAQGSRYIYGNDMIQNKMVFFSGEDSIDIQFPLLLFSAIPVNENEILGVPVESDKMFAFYNFSGDQIKSFGNFPKSVVTDMNYILSQAFVGKYDYNKANNVFVAALRYTDYLMIFSEIDKDEVYREVRGPLYYEPIFTVTNLKGNPMFTQNKSGRFSYIDVIITDNKIIGLFSGYSREEKPGKANFGNKIFIFDYGGKFLEGFYLEENLVSIAYDDVNNVLYGLDIISTDEETIFRYKL